MKRSDVDDDLVVQLAADWRSDPSRRPGVVAALCDRGVPRKLALAKVEHLVDRGLLNYGVSLNYAWPELDIDGCPRGPFCRRDHEWGHPCDRDEHGTRHVACERPVVHQDENGTEADIDWVRQRISNYPGKSCDGCEVCS